MADKGQYQSNTARFRQTALRTLTSVLGDIDGGVLDKRGGSGHGVHAVLSLPSTHEGSWVLHKTHGNHPRLRRKIFALRLLDPLAAELLALPPRREK